MTHTTPHTFHIPVMGTGFTIDTPIKVARFGISSVMSIGDDELCENMRAFYCSKFNVPYEPIKKWDPDYRARRITAYLNLVNSIVSDQIKQIKEQPFEEGREIVTYFEMLDDESSLKKQYIKMTQCTDAVEKKRLQDELRQHIVPGSLDVNIMTKIDRNNYSKDGELLPPEDSDALSALRGYAMSELESSIVFSAGFNRRLYAYVAQFDDFFPDAANRIKKKIVLKVSDFRSSWTQGKFFAKKGIWVSEHRIESGLNCGGHAFATDGFTLGPILEEFKEKKEEMKADLISLCNEALEKAGKPLLGDAPPFKITVQGGIGTANENRFLFDYFKVDGTGWATPFLLVPEATTVDMETRRLLAKASKDDLYLSDVSPLGVPFNTVRFTLSEKQRDERIESGRPGSPCPKGHLVSNTEFTKKPICTASVAYQRKKIEELKALELTEEQFKEEYRSVVAKTCLCEDLAAGALIDYSLSNNRTLKSAVCPGPNLAYFSKISSLKEMVGHIYGRINLLNDTYRPNMFISELKMYVDYLAKEIKKSLPKPTEKQISYFNHFKLNLMDGIEYYKKMVPKLVLETQRYRDTMKQELHIVKLELEQLVARHSFLDAFEAAAA